MKYKAKKALNNGVVLAQNEKGKECILIGKGLGFNLKENTIINDKEVLFQTFVLNEQTKNFSELIKSIDERIIPIVEEEIMYIQEDMNKSLNENIHVSLIDHIAFAIDRYNKGVEFTNPFNLDIRIIFAKEYMYAQRIIKRINDTFNVKLIEDETGIVAIHIHSALNNNDVAVDRKKVILIQETMNMICEEFNIEVREESLSYQRLLVHVHYAYERILQNKKIENNMMEYVFEHYSEYCQKLRNVLKKIEVSYDIEICDAEISYLVLHLIRVLGEE